MLRLKVVQFKNSSVLSCCVHKQNNCEKHSMLTHDTSKLLLSLPVKILFLMMIGFFQGCLTQTVGGQKSVRVGKKMPNPRVQESGAHHHFGFSKDNNELQGCALCFYFMMLICEHLKLYVFINLNVTINCITNISHCDIWQWNTMQQVGGSTRDPDGVYIPSINLPSTD